MRVQRDNAPGLRTKARPKRYCAGQEISGCKNLNQNPRPGETALTEFLDRELSLVSAIDFTPAGRGGVIQD